MKANGRGPPGTHAAGRTSVVYLVVDLLGDFPEAKELSQMLGSRDSAKQIAADQKG